MSQNITPGRPGASGPPPSVGAIILRWLHDQDRTLAFLVTTASIDADSIITIITGATAPSAEQLDAMALATGLDQEQLQQAAAAWSPPHQLRAFTVAQAAQLLQISDDTVRREMSRGRLGFVVISERLQRIPWSALEEILDWRTGGSV